MPGRQVEIKCLHCHAWFRSPVSMPSSMMGNVEMTGNDTNCPKCKRVTACNADNMRIRDDDGGFLGNLTN